MSEKLTVRQRQILGILNSQKERISGREIAEYLGVTDRTIRTDIQVLTDYLKPLNVEIDAIRGKGYLLVSHDAALMQSLVYQENTMLTPEDRMRSITMILLESADPVQIDDLAEECFVSRSTIEHDLKVIAFEYEREQPHIRLIRRKNTVEMEADEWKRRYVMNLLYVNRWNFNYEAGILMADLPVAGGEMTAIEDALSAAQKDCGLSLTEYDHVSFLFSVAIALRRTRMGFSIDTSTAGGTQRSGEVVDRVLAAVTDVSGETLSGAERNALSDELARREQYSPEKSEDGRELDGDSVYAEMIDEILGETDAELNTSFCKNRKLKSELLYILLTQANNPYHAGLRDEYVTRRVRAEYPDAVEIACRFEEACRRGGRETLTENYLFELVSCIAEAIEEEAERKRDGGIPVTIISHMTVGATKVLMTQIRTFFGSRVSLLGPTPVNQAARGYLRGSDLAVTTTKMRPYDRSMPYLTIPRMMDKKNFERMNFLISLENYRKLYPGAGRWITDRLSRFEVFTRPLVKGRGAALKMILKDVMERGLAREEFCEAVMTREKQTSTAFREGFAVPHAMRSHAMESGLVMWKLDSPVDWGGITVEIICLLLIGEENLAEEMRIYSCIVYMLRRLKSQKKLQELTGGEELRALLETTEKQG